MGARTCVGQYLLDVSGLVDVMLRIDTAYNHMGYHATADINVSLEANHRVSSAVPAFDPISTRCPKPCELSEYTRHMLAESLAVPIL